MESLQPFMREIYTMKPDSRLTVKDIYEDFRAWIIGKHGPSTWNNITQKQVYTALKNLRDYSYVRYREGYCLKGITYKLSRPLTGPIPIKTALPKATQLLPVNTAPVFNLPADQSLFDLPNTILQDTTNITLPKEVQLRQDVNPVINLPNIRLPINSTLPNITLSKEAQLRQDVNPTINLPNITSLNTTNITQPKHNVQVSTLNIIPTKMNETVAHNDKMKVKHIAPLQFPMIGQTKHK